MVKYYVHINRNVIDGNRIHGRNEPPISVRKGRHGKAVYAYEVKFSGTVKYGEDGKILLPCGARVVIEADEAPIIIR